MEVLATVFAMVLVFTSGAQLVLWSIMVAILIAESIIRGGPGDIIPGWLISPAAITVAFFVFKREVHRLGVGITPKVPTSPREALLPALKIGLSLFYLGFTIYFAGGIWFELRHPFERPEVYGLGALVGISFCSLWSGLEARRLQKKKPLGGTQGA